MTETQWVKDNNGVTFTPFAGKFSAGFHCRQNGKYLTSIYLIPSSETDGQSNVFVYESNSNDPSLGTTVCYVDVPGSERQGRK